MKYLVLIVTVCLAANAIAQPVINIRGTMKSMMQKGDLTGAVSIDTLKPRLHLYGIGQLENLEGEITIWDGHPYLGTVIDTVKMHVTEGYNVKAPFFVYTHVAEWKEQPLPGTVTDGKKLEAYLLSVFGKDSDAIAFRMNGVARSAKVHLVNLPKGAKVKKRKDIDRSKWHYQVKNMDIDVVGFFSTQHESVFTNHGNYVHMHMISADKAWTGHIDELLFDPEKMKLFLPVK